MSSLAVDTQLMCSWEAVSTWANPLFEAIPLGTPGPLNCVGSLLCEMCAQHLLYQPEFLRSVCLSQWTTSSFRTEVVGGPEVCVEQLDAGSPA